LKTNHLATLRSRVTRLGEWVTDYLGQFLKNDRIIPHIRATIYTQWISVSINFNKKGLDNNLGDFFTNSSGHPDHEFFGLENGGKKLEL
jgi:hypothetical protein